ncbi:phosphomannomutase (plasmid) [Legionella adelaidensis]|uniref:phosphomannomutase n=1 Tax=Legionella adelaidensis TaxID=45056 RepID=A0A0W0R5K5_9GAMM|nr:phosphomannomutase/phosphoglucomutase [Legionella adelaidensis]KTC66300.1 phosphomannomutase [Legionella adelaidensis]VEH84896.1 phosphomannomutase [Legionella adelaidensis]
MVDARKYKLVKIKRDVFRAYDIRGVIDKSFSENEYYSIGKALSYRLKSLGLNEIFIARDGRLTSFALSQALQEGFLDSGIDVVNLGEVPTPVLYYATATQPIQSGVIVTGSHNPSEYNGIKMVLSGVTLANEDIDILYNINQSQECINGVGKYQERNIIPEYCERIVQDTYLKKPYKIVVDCGNGIAGPIAPVVLEKLGCEVIPLFCDVDGNFPNHHPDPTVETNLYALKNAIKEHQADLGLAFDGDADRLGVVTNEGLLIWPDRLMMLYARDLLRKNPGANIVFDVKCSSHLGKLIADEGGNPKMCPTGHSIVKSVMKKENAALAGEMSGHLFFKDRWYGFDDALYSACRLLEILSQSPKSVSEQFNEIPDSINTPEIKILLDDDKKFQFMSRFVEKAVFAEAKIISIDGLRVEFEHGWGLIRASNTTPCLVARFEARDEVTLKGIQSIFRNQLLAIDESLSIPF